MNRSILYRAAECGWLSTLVLRNGTMRRAARRAAGRYLGGETLGEAVTEPASVERVVKEYERLNQAHQHDPVLREAVFATAGDVPLQMLLGIRGQDARQLAHAGRSVRVYVPYGSDWFRYWLRRLAAAHAVKGGM